MGAAPNVSPSRGPPPTIIDTIIRIADDPKPPQRPPPLVMESVTRSTDILAPRGLDQPEMDSTTNPPMTTYSYPVTKSTDKPPLSPGWNGDGPPPSYMPIEEEGTIPPPTMATLPGPRFPGWSEDNPPPIIREEQTTQGPQGQQARLH